MCDGHLSTGGACDSASFRFGGRSYSPVCGRINAYQKSTPDALELEATLGWKVSTLMVFPLHMEPLAHDSTSGNVVQH